MTSQDRTLDHYQELMTINATGHVLRAGRELGILDELASGQRTLLQLSETLNLAVERLSWILASLRAIGIVEVYQDDYALSSTARLLCQYDQDLGNSVWQRLVDALREPIEPSSRDIAPDLLQSRFDAIAATQWVHTPAAMQAAEILNTSDDQPDASEKQLLDFGCGSAVWSCAIAYRDDSIRLTAVDHEAALASARSMAESIQIGDRLQTIEIAEREPLWESGAFDYALIAQRLHSLPPAEIDGVLARLVNSVSVGGKVVVIDSFVGPHTPTLAESLEPLRLAVESPTAQVPTIEEAETRMRSAGLDHIQFTYIAASRIGLGMMIGAKT
ncbi:MAG: methyltransferase domain-containing protein [Planctomycetota bacterium]